MDESWESRLLGFLDDLEQQATAAFAAERELEVLERAQAEYCRVDLAGRLDASIGADLGLTVEGVGPVSGGLRRTGDGWCLLATAGGAWVVRLAAVGTVRGAAARAVPEEARPVTSRLGLGSVLRRLSGERCLLRLRSGVQLDALLGRVGADFVEAYAGDERAPTLVPYAGLAAVQQPG